jgi:lipopolysaccharide/colanic/teichoic acid biosynthesis glycosyltransferase
MNVKNFFLFVVDGLFFFGCYFLLTRILSRPPVPVTAAVLFVLYTVAFWYFRFYNIEIYFNRILYFSRIFKLNLVVFILFWGTWWFLLKTQWPTVSRLLMVSLIVVYGVLYVLSIRLFVGKILLRFSRKYLLLSQNHRKIFNEKTAGGLYRNTVHLKIAADIGREVKKGFVFIDYFPSPQVTNRAEMWEDYFNQIKTVKQEIAGKHVKVFFFNIYNRELDNGLSVVFLDQIPAIEVRSGRSLLYRRLFKKFFDYLFALVLCPVFMLLYPLLFLLIRLNFGKPVIFKQFRLTRNRKSFRLFKYRTMSIVSGVKESEVDENHRDFIKSLLVEEEKTAYSPEELVKVGKRVRKMQDRDEINLTGTFLRKTSLDELPQLFNVLRGEMSFVGPRPPLNYEVEMFPAWSQYRFNAPQGITGLWQVSGRGLMPLHTSLFLDAYYALAYSFWLDVFITFRTLRSILNVANVY